MLTATPDRSTADVIDALTGGQGVGSLAPLAGAIANAVNGQTPGGTSASALDALRGGAPAPTARTPAAAPIYKSPIVLAALAALVAVLVIAYIRRR